MCNTKALFAYELLYAGPHIAVDINRRISAYFSVSIVTVASTTKYFTEPYKLLCLHLSVGVYFIHAANGLGN
jgi:hypothetical protein